MLVRARNVPDSPKVSTAYTYLSETSVFADFIDDSIRNSVIIPADLAIRLLRKSMEDAQKQRKSIVIVDGFPRNLDQALAF